MKRILLICLLLPQIVFAQFVDDFSDGDFTSNPPWSGTAANFTVNASFELQSNGPGQSDTAYLTTAFSPNFGDTLVWEWYWKMGFNPSVNNLSRVYLASSSSNLNSALNGYAVRLGENLSGDHLNLERLDAAAPTVLIEGSINYSATPELRVKVIRYPNGHWELYSDSLAGQNYQLEGDSTDLTYTSSSHFGVWCKYSSSNSQKFWFDDFWIDSVISDTTPPELSAVTPINSNEVHVSFSEPIDSATATDAGNYNINNGVGSPTTAVLINDSTMQLSLSTSLVSGTIYELSVSDVEDLSGNVMSTAALSFKYINFSIANFRDIVINEIMADPTPVIGLPEAEFIELFNASQKTIDLSQLTFGDASSTTSTSYSGFILPSEYVILCDDADTSIFAGFGKVIPMNSLPALNNTGDEVEIRIDSVLIDAVAYLDSWYDDPSKEDGGYTLEQVDPTSPCGGLANWKASINASGGTPGQENSVFDTIPNAVPPAILELSVISGNQISVTFDKFMDSTSVASASYQTTPALTVQSVVATQNSPVAVIAFSTPIDPSVLYSISIDAVSDCAGNTATNLESDFGIGTAPSPFDLVISELYPDPDETSAIPAIEFVEITNRSTKLIQLGGVELSDLSSSVDLPSGLLKPGEYAIVLNNDVAAEFVAYGVLIEVGTLPSLNNSEDRIFITTSTEVIDQVSYDDSWYGVDEKSSGGWTLERINLENFCGSQENWTASNDASGGTPGQVNSVNSLSAVPPPSVVNASFTSLHTLELEFNQVMDTLIMNSGTYRNEQFEMSFGSSGRVATHSWEEEFFRRAEHTFDLYTFNNCVGQPLLDTSITLYLHDESDVFINEILFNPRGSGTDYVELFNSASRPINLAGWSLGYMDNNDSLRFNSLSTDLLEIGSEDYTLLHEDSADVKTNYPFAVDSNFHEMNLPTYANSIGVVMLYDQFKVLMDSVHYNEDMHFPLIKDPDGVALERLSTDRQSVSDDNWHSASSTDNYGTPGYRNSQDYTSVSEVGWSVSAEYISPDNDGYQDVVNFDYTLNDPGQSATISIYNDKGVLIRTLVSNQLLGESGSFTWDGTNDEGEKARTGIHVAVIEAFDLSGQRTTTRLPLVVATRLN